MQIERERIDFFPRKAALKLKDRAAEVTTEDLAKTVNRASHDLEAEISSQSKETEEGVISRLSKRLPQGDLQDDLLSIRREVQEKFEDMYRRVDDRFGDVYRRVDTVQDELHSIRVEMQRKFVDVHRRVGTVQQTLIEEQRIIGQEFAGIRATMQTILDRLPASSKVSCDTIKKAAYYISQLHTCIPFQVEMFKGTQPKLPICKINLHMLLQRQLSHCNFEFQL